MPDLATHLHPARASSPASQVSLAMNIHMQRLLLPLLGCIILTRPMYSQPQVTGQWQTLPFLLPLNPIHVMLLHDNKILVVAGSENDPNEHAAGVSKAAAID